MKKFLKAHFLSRGRVCGDSCHFILAGIGLRAPGKGLRFAPRPGASVSLGASVPRACWAPSSNIPCLPLRVSGVPLSVLFLFQYLSEECEAGPEAPCCRLLSAVVGGRNGKSQAGAESGRGKNPGLRLGQEGELTDVGCSSPFGQARRGAQNSESQARRPRRCPSFATLKIFLYFHFV